MSRKPGGVVGVVVADHAVRGVAGAGDEGAHVDVREHLAGDGVERHVRVVDARRLVEARGLGRVVALGHEGRRRQARAPRLVPEEAHAVVEREPARGFPGVLQIRLHLVTVGLHLRQVADLGVVAEDPQERVRVGVAGVERVRGVGAEVELAGPGARAHAAEALGVLELLDVQAALPGVAALDPGQVVAERVEPGDAAVPHQAVLEREVRLLPAAGDRHVEGRLRQRVDRVHRIQLAERVAVGRAPQPAPVVLGHRVEALRLAAHADGGLVDQVRVDHLRVVQAAAAVGVQVVGVEPAPLGGTGGDLGAPLIGPPVLVGEVEAVGGRGPPVEAQDVVDLRVVVGLLPLEVEVGVAGHVRQRQHVQEREPVRVDAARGHHVPRERLAGERVADRDQCAVQVAGLREVAGALRLGRHAVAAERSGPLGDRGLDRVEEEELLLAASVEPRNRTADVRAPGVVAVAGARAVRGVVEEIVRVPVLVAPVPVRVAVVVRAAALAHDLDLGAGAAAVLRAVAVEQHLDLLDRVEVDLLRHAVGLADLVAEDTVDHDRVPVAALAAHVGNERAEALAERLDRVLVAHAGRQAQQRRDVASLDLDLVDLVGRDAAAVLAVLGADRRARRLDHDALPEADHEPQRAERQAVGGAQHGALALERPEVRELDPDRVAAGPQRGHEEAAPRVGRGGAALPRRLVDHRHGRACQRLPGLVGDASGERARALLRTSGASGQRERHEGPADPGIPDERPATGHVCLPAPPALTNWIDDRLGSGLNCYDQSLVTRLLSRGPKASQVRCRMSTLSTYVIAI